MKNLLKFCFGILILLFISCSNESKAKRLQDNDGLIFVKDEKTQTLFYMSGTKIEDITRINVVGVQHTPSDQVAGIDPTVRSSYEMFWDLYLRGSRIEPSNITLALEMGTEVSKNTKIGDVYVLREPNSLITPWMIKRGLKKVRISDPRVKSPELFALYKKSFELFIQRGGVVSSFEMSRGFPLVVITKEPVLSKEDIDWIQNEWYPKCYLKDKEFETIIWNNCLKGDIAIVGAAHAFRLEREYGARIALTISPAVLLQTAHAMTFDNYYLKVIKK